MNLNASVDSFLPQSEKSVGLRVKSCICLSVSLSVCPVRALTFESLDLETSLLVCSYIFRISRSCLYTKVIGSRSRSQDQKSVYVYPV